MEIEKAIETLRDVVDCNIVPYPPDFKEAVSMGKNALVYLKRMADTESKRSELYKRLDVERRKYVPDPRD